LDFSLAIKTTASRSSVEKPESDSRHLYTGHRLHNFQIACKLFPEYFIDPSFDVIYRLTMLQQWFRIIRLSDSHLPDKSDFSLNAHDHDSLPQPLKLV